MVPGGDLVEEGLSWTFCGWDLSVTDQFVVSADVAKLHSAGN